MNSSPAEILQQYFVDNGVLNDPGSSWPCYIAVMPDDLSEDSLVSLFDQAGNVENPNTGSTTTIHEGVQILLRGTSYNAAYQKMKGIISALDLINNTVVTVNSNDEEIKSVQISSSIISLGTDHKRRFIMSLNVLATFDDPDSENTGYVWVSDDDIVWSGA